MTFDAIGVSRCTQPCFVVATIDFDHIITHVMGVHTGPYLLQISDEAGYTLSNNPIHCDCFIGSAEHPHYVNPFFSFFSGQTLVFNFTNLHTAENKIFLVFETIRLPNPKFPN